MLTEGKSVTVETASASSSPAKLSSWALLFELEFIVGNARRAAYDTLRGILEEKSIAFPEVVFSRVCTSSPPEHYIEAVQDAVGARKLSTRKLIEDVTNGILLSMSSSSLRVPDAIRKILETAKERGTQLAALTTLPESVYKILLEKAGLSSLGIVVRSFEQPDESWPRADTWLMLSKDVGCPIGHCLAMVSSSRSNRAALTAGMRSVAFPDVYTRYQDFGGAHLVVEDQTAFNIDELFELVPAST